MKYRCTLVLTFLILMDYGYADETNIKMSSQLKPYITFNDINRIYLKDNKVIIRTENILDGKVIISENFELIVDRDTLILNNEQQKCVFEYYQLVDESMEAAENIGWEGAKVGVQGAAIGIKAVAGVFRMILPNYSSEDFERDMEYEAAKIEAKAEKLEERAEIIDEKLESLEELHNKLKEEIIELQDLDWF